jgi:hypothetical protein
MDASLAPKPGQNHAPTYGRDLAESVTSVQSAVLRFDKPFIALRK